MKKYLLFILLLIGSGFLYAQSDLAVKPVFTVIKANPATSVKNQAVTGTCWSFSTTSLVESQAIRDRAIEVDLSEMFTVRNIYVEKAKNYILRQGKAQFSEGALGHDQIRAIETYGAMPELAYSGLKAGQTRHDHQKLVKDLKTYLDKLLEKTPVAENWLSGFANILDAALGVPPAEFEYYGKRYTAKSFARDMLVFNSKDYVCLTSFTHHPFYEPFILEVPDNFSNGAYYNIPLNELIETTKEIINQGYSVMWDADVSNKGFMQNKGIAVYLPEGDDADPQAMVAGSKSEGFINSNIRQQLFENLTTQDDHLMHITGLEKDENGKIYFIVKNSWGEVGPDKGYIHVSEAYFAINTIGLIVPREALNKALINKLNLK